MKKTKAILFLLLITLAGSSQVVFKTIAPTEPVVVGESFRIQYYVEGSPAHELTPPDFYPFRLVEGPDIYPGKSNGTGLLFKNYVYTLVAAQPGEYRIPGASLRTGNSILQSSNARITVISAARSMESANRANGPTGFYLGPEENAQKKIKENLFLRVTTDKKTCYVGEPVLVTYKLYSRLESSSDIIKNPGFYGFTVHDMVGLQDQLLSTEQVNGKDFDVHVIRKLQLYPLQAGRFTIDPMEIKNRVKFSTQVMNRKTQQRIAEGMMGAGEEEPEEEGVTVVENQLRTDPLSVEVKPLPEKNKPDDFNAAVGNFSLQTRLEQSSLARNEEGFLLVTIEGKGNFVQLSAPVIEWPAGIEGFGAVVTDSLDKLKIPLAGKRQFRFGFVCTEPGAYKLPVVRFSFFDTDSNRYRSLVSKALEVNISNQEKKRVQNEEHKISIDELSQQKSRIAIIVVFLLVSSVLAYWALKKKPVAEIPAPVKKVKPDIGDLLTDATGLVAGDAPAFYATLHRAIWDYFQEYFEIAGSARNKETLFSLLRGKGADEEKIDSLATILSDCETGIYTNTVSGKSNAVLLEETRVLLEKMNGILF
jgi:hypothetical protein